MKNYPKNVFNMSVPEAIFFIKKQYFTLSVCAIFGVAVALLILSATKERFEAASSIQMKKILVPGERVFINIEQPNALISRFFRQSEVSPALAQDCGESPVKSRGLDEPIGSVRLSIENGLNDRVVIRAYGASRESAIKCVNSVVEWILSSQASLAAPYIASVDKKIADYEVQLEVAKRFLDASAKSPDQSMMLYYYSSKIHELSDKLYDLKMNKSLYENVEENSKSKHTLIVDNNGRPLKLIILTVMIGLLIGLFFGAIISIYRECYKKNN